MNVWRLLPLETYNAYMNMAIDEAIFHARINGLVPDTLRFYRWSPSAVSVGRFQRIEEQVFVENCNKLGVDVVRRITGGGTVYHDETGEITYSVVARKTELGTEDVALVYKKICGGLIEAVKLLGVEARFSPGDVRQCPNITINEKKISGSAQSHRGGVVLQHGTLLVDVDLHRMFNVLRVPWAKSVSEVVCVAERKITSLKNELRRDVSLQEVYAALIEGFRKALNVEFVEGKLTPYEANLSQKLFTEKFSKQEWNFLGKC